MARMMMFLIFLLAITYVCKPSAASANVGSEYIVVFLQHVVSNSQLDIFITTDEASVVNVIISAPLLKSSQYPYNVTVTKHNFARITLDEAVSLNFTGRYNSGVLLSSDGEITVQCFSSSISGIYTDSIGGYLALSTSSLGLEYMIATFCEKNTCIFAVAGIEDETLVTISIKLPPSVLVTLEDKTYIDGDVFNVTINRGEVIQIIASGSLSGTLVTATRKIAVFVGADYTSANGSSMDHIVEQLPPLDSWGMDYILLPFPGRSSFDIVIVTAQFEQTSIRYNNVPYAIIAAGGKLTLNLDSKTPSTLSSDKRIIVMHISTSYGSDTAISDPSMVLVPPVDQWVSSYLFVSPNVLVNSDPVSLVLAVNSSCLNQVKLMLGTQEQSLTWTKLGATTRSISYTTLDGHGPFSLISRKMCPIGGYIYGPGYHSAWVMPIGQSVKKLPDKRYQVESSSIHIASSDIMTSSILSSVIESSDIMTSSILSSAIESSDIVITPSRVSSMTSYVQETSVLNSSETSSLEPSSSVLGSLRPPLCSCTCRITRTVKDFSSKIVEIQKNLTVEKKTLSSTKRKNQSAVDTRTSSLTIGAFGIAFISVTLVMISVPDLVQVISYLISVFKAEDSAGLVIK